MRYPRGRDGRKTLAAYRPIRHLDHPEIAMVALAELTQQGTACRGKESCKYPEKTLYDSFESFGRWPAILQATCDAPWATTPVTFAPSTRGKLHGG